MKEEGASKCMCFCAGKECFLKFMELQCSLTKRISVLQCEFRLLFFFSL